MPGVDIGWSSSPSSLINLASYFSSGLEMSMELHTCSCAHLRVVVVVVAIVRGEGLALLLLFAFSVGGATVAA